MDERAERVAVAVAESAGIMPRLMEAKIDKCVHNASYDCPRRRRTVTSHAAVDYLGMMPGGPPLIGAEASICIIA